MTCPFSEKHRGNLGLENEKAKIEKDIIHGKHVASIALSILATCHSAVK